MKQKQTIAASIGDPECWLQLLDEQLAAFGYDK
jgi:hypothetical protein